MLPVKGRNDRTFSSYLISAGEFDDYAQNRRRVEECGIRVVPEGNDLEPRDGGPCRKVL